MDDGPISAPTPTGNDAPRDPAGSFEDPTHSPKPASAPSKRGYVIAAILAVLGLTFGGGGLLVGLNQVSDKVDGFQRIDVPGSGAVRFTAPGEFTVYYEATGTTADGGVNVSLPPVQILLTGGEGGEPVRLSEYEGSLNYDVGGHEGFAVATFRIDTPGTYVLAGDATIAPGIAQLAVGHGLGGDLVQTILPGLVLFLAFLAAAIVAIVTFVRRRRARRRFSGRPLEGFVQ